LAVNRDPVVEKSLAFRRALSGARILLVEDNDINQQVAREILELANITVLLAENGAQAVRMVLQETVPLDGVLMDVRMPVMDGLMAARAIRAAGITALPILAMTANAMAGDRERCLAAGMQDHIAKPIHPDALYAMLTPWIRPAHPEPLPEGLVELTPVVIDPAWAPVEIPGLDVESGVLRMSGNFDGYLGVLNRFLVNQRGAVGSIHQALEGSDLSTAQRVAHTLKGVAATIGADELSEMAARIEEAIGAGEGRARIDGMLDAAATRLSELCAAMEPVVARRSIPVVAAEVVQREPTSLEGRRELLLRRLHEQLAIFDADAEATLATLRREFSGEAWLAGMGPVEEQVGRYDFDGAMKRCRAWFESLPFELEAGHG
ncbi:MAG: response regulator, partial [Magnetococcales bacterium]|nr:response regulator [Magnetococcales bacterium]